MGCIIGIDEAGRGPIAGPVIAAAAWIDFAHTNKDCLENCLSGIKDSKMMTAKTRENILQRCQSFSRIALGAASAHEIDQLNIHYATLMAMKRAFHHLGIWPDEARIDGKFCPDIPCHTRAIVQGDATDISIGLASIAAKVCRDKIMERLNQRYPHYDWVQNKGYPTRKHIELLRLYGPNRHFRFSFSPVQTWQKAA